MSAAPAIANLTNMIATIRGWINVKNAARVSDAVIVSWIRMAEERINEELRCAEMFKSVQGLFTANGQTLPDDYLEANYVKSVAAPYLSYKNVTPEEYFRQVNRQLPATQQGTGVAGYPVNPLTFSPFTPYTYCIQGNALFVSPAVDTNNGTLVELGYMARLQPLGDDVVNADGTVTYNGNWLNTRYTRLYTFASLALSAPYLVEDDRFTMWESEATRLLNMMNTRYNTSRRGKGPIKTNYRSFG